MAANRIKTSQFGFPTAPLADAYTASGYAASVRDLAAISYAAGHVATLTVGVAA